MKRSIIKPILIGILIGTAAFFAPFLMLKVLGFVLILGLIFKLFWWGSWRHRGGWGGHHGRMSYGVLFADKIRSMSEEEYAEFKNKYANDSCGDSCGCGCGCGSHGCCGDCDSKEKSTEKTK
jgi:hypothetical protein